MGERGLAGEHPTISRWVPRYAPELEKRCRPHLKTTTDLWRVDETSVKVKGVWMYLYRAVDSQTTPEQIPYRSDRTSSSLHHTTGQARDGLLVL